MAQNVTEIPKKSVFTYENPEGTQWMFHVDPSLEAKININFNKPKVAFLSNSARTYYPYDAGHSRLALENRNTTEEDLRDAYLPDNDLLQKPISTRGYGIGGLSSKRFSRPNLENLPGPNHYRLQSSLKSGVRRFPDNVLVNLGLLDRERKSKIKWSNRSQQLRAASSFDVDGREEAVDLWDKCFQMNIAFGSCTSETRFKKQSRWNNVGPGHYNLRETKVRRVPVETVFMSGPARINPPTKLHCSYGPKENCVECNKELMLTFDYYRSKFKVTLPDGPIKSRKVLLCRECYCKGIRGESKYWKKKSQVEWLFEKTRHCGYVHEHQNLPQYTNKVTCSLLRRLTRKEAVSSKHWPDKCERKLKEKKYHKWE